MQGQKISFCRVDVTHAVELSAVPGTKCLEISVKQGEHGIRVSRTLDFMGVIKLRDTLSDWIVGGPKSALRGDGQNVLTIEDVKHEGATVRIDFSRVPGQAQIALLNLNKELAFPVTITKEHAIELRDGCSDWLDRTGSH